MELTNSFPPVDAAIVKLKEFDYVQLGEDVIKYTATVSAVVVGIVSYVWTALQLWWEDNGEATQVNLIRFVVNVIDFIGEFVIATPKVYRWAQLNTNRVVDSLFFQVAYN